ncbi:MAG: hypothetical protein QN155_09125 [Armatimonadota bacterium]|nr:hypothetical protein [Armatimonadota bacterium]MDR7611162.1 hypothetical protein [Armatimonadota bacterium]
MSFFRRVLGRWEMVTSTAAEVTLPGNGTFPLAIVGESKYQHHLEAICGGRTEEGVDITKSARLVLEDTNPYDRNAVRIEIEGRVVGYLNRQDARAYREYLERIGAVRAIGICEARIRGGWKRGEHDQGHFGVWLDFTLHG